MSIDTKRPIQKAALDYYYTAIQKAFNGKVPSNQQWTTAPHHYSALYNVALALAPIKDGKHNFESLIWRLAYLLRHLEESDDNDKTTKRLQICFFVNYLLLVTDIKLQNCNFDGGGVVADTESKSTKNALDLFTKARNLALQKQGNKDPYFDIKVPYNGWIINSGAKSKYGIHPILSVILLLCIVAVVVSGAAGGGLLGAIATLILPGSLGLLFAIPLLLINIMEKKRFDHIQTHKEMINNLDNILKPSDTENLQKYQACYQQTKADLESNSAIKPERAPAWKDFSAAVKVGLQSKFFSQANDNIVNNANDAQIPQNVEEAHNRFSHSCKM